MLIHPYMLFQFTVLALVQQSLHPLCEFAPRGVSLEILLLRDFQVSKVQPLQPQCASMGCLETVGTKGRLWISPHS